MTTDRILNIENSLYDSNWYEIDVDIRKYIILIISRAQKPIFFTGFGIVYCSLEVFGKVSFNS